MMVQTKLQKTRLKILRIQYIKLSRNFGYQANIKAGYDNCTGDAAIQLDADGEDDPNIISKFLREWEDGFDGFTVWEKKEKKEFY